MDEFVVQGAMEKKFFKVWCSMFRGGANLVALRSISCAIIRRVEGFHLHPRVSREPRVSSPSEIRGREKNVEESRSWPEYSATLGMSSVIRELDLCDGDGQRGDGAEVSNHSCNRITRSILSSYPPRFFALATFWSSFLLQALLSGTFLSKWPDPTPKFTKRSDRRRIRFCSYSFLFHLVFSTSFLNRIQTAESSGWLQSNFMFFLLWNFYSCRVTLHYSPACGLYYVFVLLQRPVSIYTKRIFRGVSSHLGTQLRQFEQLVKISFAIWLYRNFTFHVCFFSEQRDCFLFFFCNNNFFFLMTNWQIWKIHALSENSFDFLPLSLIPTIVKIRC